MTITSEQCRGARAMLGWTADQLASAAKVSPNTVRRFEGGKPANAGTIALLRQALEAAGVDFIDANGGGAGVRVRAR